MQVYIGIAIFIMFMALTEGAYYAYRTSRYARLSQVRSRLKKVAYNPVETTGNGILRVRMLSSVPLLNRLLSSISLIHRLDRIMLQANVQQPISNFFILTLILMLGGYLAGSALFGDPLRSIAVSLGLACVPLIYVTRKKKQRMLKLERQLPDALDTIARAMRAGHAFPTALQMIGEEFDDPIGTEFERTFDEINFGVSAVDALKNLSQRVDCPDLQYFVVSVIVQRETGGNLAEILENLAFLIRERFKFQGKLRALAAETKLSGIILIILPFFLVLVVSFVAPDYIAVLFEDPIGRVMCFIAMGFMFIGYLAIKKMSNISV